MKLIAYLRVSTAKQVREGYGLEAQREAIEKYCRAYGHEVIAWYSEQVSAFKERPQFQAALAKLLENRVDGLVIYKLDRIGRSVRDLANTVNTITTANKKLISVSDNIDTSTPNGRLLLNILAALAEYEYEIISERTRLGREIARAKGKKFGPPFKPIDEKVLKELKAKGVSHRAIARALGVNRSTVLRRLRMLGLR